MVTGDQLDSVVDQLSRTISEQLALPTNDQISPRTVLGRSADAAVFVAQINDSSGCPIPSAERTLSPETKRGLALAVKA